MTDSKNPQVVAHPTPRNGHWVYKTYKAKANSKRTLSEKIADLFTTKSGSMVFLLINIAWFLSWIVMNLGLIPQIKPIDPYPFGFLTMIVSLEAIILAIIVLISQNREQKINEIREETLLMLNTIQEKEITKTLEILTKIAEKQGLEFKDDRDLARMLQQIDLNNIEKKLEKEI